MIIQLTLVLSQEIEKAFVVVWRHVERPHEARVVAVGLLQPFPYNEPHLIARQVASHKRPVHRRPERLATHENAI